MGGYHQFGFVNFDFQRFSNPLSITCTVLPLFNYLSNISSIFWTNVYGTDKTRSSQHSQECKPQPSAERLCNEQALQVELEETAVFTPRSRPPPLRTEQFPDHKTINNLSNKT